MRFFFPVKAKARPLRTHQAFVPFPRLKKDQADQLSYLVASGIIHSGHSRLPTTHVHPHPSNHPYLRRRPAAAVTPPALPEPAGARKSCDLVGQSSPATVWRVVASKNGDRWPRSPPAPASAAPAPRLSAGSRAARGSWSPAGGPPRAFAPPPPPRRPRLPLSSSRRSKNNDLAKLVQSLPSY